MGKLDLITTLSSVEEALKRAPRAGDCRKLAARLAVVRSGLLIADLPGRMTDPEAAMAALVQAAHAMGVDNIRLVQAFNSAVEKFPR